MANNTRHYLGIDYGTVRVGLARADSMVCIAYPVETLDNDARLIDTLSRYIKSESIDTVVVGYPRNQSGESTQQTEIVEAFANSLEKVCDVPIVFQDESLTSVTAENYLKQSKKPYTKGDIDARAAAILLEDYITTHE